MIADLVIVGQIINEKRFNIAEPLAGASLVLAVSALIIATTTTSGPPVIEKVFLIILLIINVPFLLYSVGKIITIRRKENKRNKRSRVLSRAK
jgi:hypothetical protein